MAKKTAKRSTKRNSKRTGSPSRGAPAKAAATAVLDVRVDFGGVSIGDGTARIGVKVDRGQLPVDRADEILCGRRLTGVVQVSPGGDDPDQTYLVDEMRHEISSVFDVKRFGVSPKAITAGLTFATGEIDISELGHFAKQKGRLVITEVASISVFGEEADDDEFGEL